MHLEPPRRSPGRTDAEQPGIHHLPWQYLNRLRISPRSVQPMFQISGLFQLIRYGRIRHVMVVKRVKNKFRRECLIWLWGQKFVCDIERSLDRRSTGKCRSRWSQGNTHRRHPAGRRLRPVLSHRPRRLRQVSTCSAQLNSSGLAQQLRLDAGRCAGDALHATRQLAAGWKPAAAARPRAGEGLFEVSGLHPGAAGRERVTSATDR